ncbi:hypothetical protein OBBRIDRAFT_205220 [Obba rivulosa]|uniref:Uncharacterized protein n=1 Tax=Obba rivulosa TaxID=1052685 RepID=A0A8E2AQY9_9APHY|nr:hypothetical protein OBBRIDRAFT_205220 [Obba rivulosa]
MLSSVNKFVKCAYSGIFPVIQRHVHCILQKHRADWLDAILCLLPGFRGIPSASIGVISSRPICAISDRVYFKIRIFSRGPTPSQTLILHYALHERHKGDDCRALEARAGNSRLFSSAHRAPAQSRLGRRTAPAGAPRRVQLRVRRVPCRLTTEDASY